MKNIKMFGLVAVLVAVVAFGIWAMGGSGFLQGKIQAVKVPFTLSVAAVPGAQNVKEAAVGVNLAAWNIKADRNIVIDELGFTFNGDKPEVLKNLVLKIGDQKIADGVLSKKNVTFKNVKFSLEKGKTKVIALYADISSGTGDSMSTFQMVLRNVKATDSNTAKKYEQNYSLIGPVVTVGSPSVVLSLAPVPVAGSTEYVKGSTNVKFVGISAACGSLSDCLVKDISLTGDFDEEGDANDFTAGADNGVNLNSIVGAVRLEDSAGTPIAAAKPVESDGKVYFDQINWSIKKGQKAIFYVVGDISSNGYANGTKDNISFGINAATDFQFEDEKGSAWQASGTVNLSNDVYVTVIGNGKLTLTFAPSNYFDDILKTGTQDNLVSRFKAESTWEAYKIQKLTIKNYYKNQPGDADGFVKSVKLSYVNSGGVTEFKTGSLVGGELKFTGMDAFVPKDSSANLELFVDTNSSAYPNAGKKISLDLVDFEAVGQTSGESFAGVKTGTVTPGFFTIYTSKVSLDPSPLSPSGAAKLSANDRAFAFKVSADGQDDVKLNRIVIETISDADFITNASVSAKLFSHDGELLDSTKVQIENSSEGVIVFDNLNIEIPKNSSRDYILELDTVSLMDEEGGKDDSLLFKIKYGKSFYGDVIPGGLWWENQGEVVKWLGKGASVYFNSPVLYY